MKNIPKEISDRIDKIVDAIPGAIHQAGWNVPGINKADLVAQARTISSLLENHREEIDPEDYETLSPAVERLDFLLTHTVPQLQQQTAAAVPAYLITLEQIKRRIKDVLPEPDIETQSRQISRQRLRIRSMETRLNELEPRSTEISTMLTRIEEAYDAADRLPTDLEALNEAKTKIDTIAEKASSDATLISELLTAIEQQNAKMQSIHDNATAVLEKCETAYASSTSVGLAAAFSERSVSLNKSIYVWLVGLVIALGIGGAFGFRQITQVTALMALPNVPIHLILINLTVTIFSVGAPIWFAWLATKQIGQRFRLSEDYAFKASISRAYEGYRREAARIDSSNEHSDMEAQLLRSALTRLDELPLRLVEAPSHGSPWSEILASDTIREAVKTVPGFANSISELASKKLSIFRKNQTSKPNVNTSKKIEIENEES